MRFPTSLRRGDKVRVIAASSAFEPAKLERGLDLLRAAGLVPVFDDGLFARRRYLAGDDERRMHELRAALDDPDSRAIWAARGGYGAARALAACTAERMARARKWLIGFSDVTTLHAVWASAGIGSIHGANVTTLPQWSPEARDGLFRWLLGDAPVQTFNGRTLCQGDRVTGPIWGGNLTVIASLAGTGHLPSLRGAILLLEDVGERPYRLDRCLTQLRLAGALDGVLGVAVGQLTDCEETRDGADYGPEDVVADVLRPLHIPVVAGLPFGHEPSSHAVGLGAAATLDARAGILTLTAAKDVQRF